MWLFLLIFSCNKEVPPHLRVDYTPQDLHAPPSLKSLLASDPLVRRPNSRGAGAWDSLEESSALNAWASVARLSRPEPSDWLALESQNRGTIAVALARGAMLAGVESSHGDWGHPQQARLSAYLGLTAVGVRPIGVRPSAPGAWLPGLEPKTKVANARHMATRMVLSGWLDGPKIDLSEVGQALGGEAYTGLADTPMGALIVARSNHERTPGAHEEGKAHLWRASAHALNWVGADTNTEQTAMQSARQLSRDTHGGTPTAMALQLAYAALKTNAGADDSTGLAMVAIIAQRLEGSCPDTPCEGLDRVATLQRAKLWGADAEIAALIWTLIATKQALDTLEIALVHPSLSKRLPQVADALNGFNLQPTNLAFLRNRVQSPALLMSISRMAGGPDVNDKDAALDAVRSRLISLCDQAISMALPDTIIEPVQRIRLRAQRAIDKP